MASTNAPAADKAQKKPTKQPARRVVPVIPRQLVRPKKQVAEVKQVKEAVIAPEETALSPKAEPVAETAVEQDTHAERIPFDDVEKAGEKDEPVNGHAVDEPAVVVVPEQSLSPETSARQTEGQVTLDEVKPEEPEPEPEPEQNKQEQSGEESKASIAPPKPVKAARASLPPPFVPSRELHSFASSSTSTVPPSATFPIGPHHSIQPSVEGLMFGGYRDSANISPVSMQMSASPHPQPFVNGAHHGPHFSGDGYPPSYQFNATTAGHQPNPDHIPSFNAQPVPFPRTHMNGINYMSRTPSQTSSVAFDPPLGHHSGSGIITPEFVPHVHHRESVHDHRQIAHTQRVQHSGVPTPMQQPPMQQEIANMQAMRHYLLDRFGGYDFADYVLDLAVNKSLPVHSLILARSSGMRSIFHRARKDEGSQFWRLRISGDEYYKQPDAFVDAVRYLYGGDLLDAAHLLQAIPSLEVGNGKAENEMNARMTYVLSYIASGLTLDVPEIHIHGVQIADRLLRWENIELVLELALKSRFQQSIPVQHVLRTAVDFIIFNFPIHFALDTTAPQLVSLPRLVEQQLQSDTEPPLIPRSRRQSHHRLKSIRFGDAPAGLETPLQASILSSVLISLPYEILTSIFQSLALKDRLGNVLVSQHMYAVVGEREKRRMGSMRAYSQTSDYVHNVDPIVTQNMAWEESVEPSDDNAVGLRIVRRRVEDASINGYRHR